MQGSQTKLTIESGKRPGAGNGHGLLREVRGERQREEGREQPCQARRHLTWLHILSRRQSGTSPSGSEVSSRVESKW